MWVDKYYYSIILFIFSSTNPRSNIDPFTDKFVRQVDFGGKRTCQYYKKKKVKLTLFNGIFVLNRTRTPVLSNQQLNTK